ncbi:MAG: hypothetical protein ACI35S_09770 [Anaeroplasma sp.]
MKENKYYFEYSLSKLDSFPDHYYFEEKVKRQNYSKIKEKMEELNSLIDRYKLEIDVNERTNIINNIIILINDKTLSVTPFVQSFCAYDMTYSLYKKLNADDQIRFLREILDRFLVDRWKYYKNLNINSIIMINDMHSHKRMAQKGVKKLVDNIKARLKLKEIKSTSLKNKQFFLPDRLENKKSSYVKFLKELDIEEDEKTVKLPDMVVKINDIFYIIEHKHIKENGGGQDKQLNELYNLLEKKHQKICYIACMDGYLFNRLEQIDSESDKKLKDTILAKLEKNENNYFVNVSGLIELFEEVLEG